MTIKLGLISADPERKREAENEGNSEACDLEADGDGGGSPLPGMATNHFLFFKKNQIVHEEKRVFF